MSSPTTEQLVRAESRRWLDEHVDPVLRPLLQQLVACRPTNPVAFLQQALASASPTNLAVVPGTGNVIAELPPEEEVEADTGAQEDAGDLNSILLPNGVLPSDVFQFSVSYKQAAFDGWVKQHSPACAAASIAGAWNIIHGYSRDHPDALNQDIVVEALKSIMTEKINARRASLERGLLGADFSRVIEAVREDLVSQGLTLEKKGVKAGKVIKDVRRLACELAADDAVDAAASPTTDSTEGTTTEQTSLSTPTHRLQSIAADDSAWKHTDEAWVRLRELYAEECRRKASELGSEADVSGKDDDADDVDVEDSDAFGDDDDEAGGEADGDGDGNEGGDGGADALRAPQPVTAPKPPVVPRSKNGGGSKTKNMSFRQFRKQQQKSARKRNGKGGRRKKKSKKSSFQWKKLMSQLFRFLIGREKLCRPRPSTAAFGNWGILQGVKWLRDNRSDEDVTARLVMGKGLKTAANAFNATPKDDSERKATLWAALRSEFLRKDTALIYHLRNHYALLFALREWVEPDGTQVRQVLTTRRGQRPSTWIDFEEIHGTFLKWGGHKIMAVRKPSSLRTSITPLDRCNGAEAGDGEDEAAVASTGAGGAGAGSSAS